MIIKIIHKVKRSHPEFDDYYLEYDLVDMGLFPTQECDAAVLWNSRQCNSSSCYYSKKGCKQLSQKEIDEYWQRRRDRILDQRNNGRPRRKYKSRGFNTSTYRWYRSDEFQILYKDEIEFIEI